jgi:hypothetical protein
MQTTTPTRPTPPVALSPSPQALACGDIQMYKGALEALLSYNPFWLRLGMEVLTQRAVVPPPGTAQSGGKGPGEGAGGGSNGVSRWASHMQQGAVECSRPHPLLAPAPHK